MIKRIVGALAIVVTLSAVAVWVAAYGRHSAAAEAEINSPSLDPLAPAATDNGFSVEVLVSGYPTTEYAARGRRYIEALENAEYELRIHNPTASRVAVALSVDGLNTIDARHTSAWDAHKWVIDPYGTITVRGWQMSSENARRFYFTTERDSYAAKLGQAANLGVISAVFFRERAPIRIMKAVPPDPIFRTEDRRAPKESTRGESTPAQGRAANGETANSAKPATVQPYPPPDDESAATGIGRSVRNDVQWIHLDLDPKAAGEVTIRYEYREALVKLGIIPRDYPRPNVLDRRERAQGFEPKYCPQP
ncbi:MAG TPA: hypothetical protein VE863_20970 [Pyrinomonadaceae bacterium]|nr:hypothetical protein [Pyrinomonadaceae bacterium]